MTGRRLPLTHAECRARFFRAAVVAGLRVRSDPIEARGPDDQRLAVDSVWVGDRRPHAALVVLSGVHGVEGFIGSALQSKLLERLAGAPPAPGTAVLVVHAVNPWGMAWWRRQNESNVDLNRNWHRDSSDPPPNDVYDELHPLVCPDVTTLPSVEELLTAATDLVAQHGVEWVRDGITRGQYRHPDGLHYGGARTEPSTRIVSDLASELVGVERALVVDLHTGHGPHGQLTLLSDQPPGSDQDVALRSLGATVEATVDNPTATTGLKSAQIANGIRAMLGTTRCHATSAELGTTTDLEQLAATYLESWVHRHGDVAVSEHAEIAWRYRCCFTPDDAAWATTCLASGSDVLDRALAWVGVWPSDGQIDRPVPAQ